MRGPDNGKRGPKDDSHKGGKNQDHFAVRAMNLPKISEKDLKDLFAAQGHRMVSAKVLADKKQAGQFFAYLNFKSETEAQRCIKELNGS